MELNKMSWYRIIYAKLHIDGGEGEGGGILCGASGREGVCLRSGKFKSSL